MSTVLLTDAQQRKTLAAVRSLGWQGVRVLAAEDTRWATARFSKYCSEGLVYPSPTKEPARFWQWLEQILERHPGAVLFPMDDATMEIAMEHKARIEQLCKVALPDMESYRIASDKGLATMAALEAGLECPKTVMITPGDMENVAELASGLKFPVVLKPRKSSGSRGIVLIADKGGLVEAYRKVHERYPYPLIQECIGLGTRYDVCLIFNYASELKGAFVQQEIRHFPLERGPSTVQESVWRPDLVEMAARLMQRLNWVGIAEVEFMVDPLDGKPKFMEINPRFWGSLHLAVLAGVDFPFMLYQLATEGDIVANVDRDIEGQDSVNYALGLKCSWTLPGDILHFIYNKKRREMEPPFWPLGPKKNSGVYDDIISAADPGPILGFILASLHYLPNREMWRFLLRR